MKILKLSFKNLNSLYGQWNIDFTNKAYTDSGLFALTGSTGAGKSTILDAICLALYAQTPRLEKVNKSSNGIMSVQTGECFSEVTFETEKGTFTSRFEQRRARNSATGALQEHNHKVFNTVTGESLCDKKSETPAKIIDLIGMDFNRFTRSCLLAQGSFDSFLKANIEEKSKILEDITGSEIYSDISRYVQSEHSRQKSILDNLVKENDSVNLLSPEELTATQDLAKSLQAKIKKQTDLISLDKECKSWLELGIKLQGEISRNNIDFERNKSDIELFKPKADALSLHEKTIPLQVPYANLKSLQTTQNKDLKSLDTLQAKTASLKETLDKAISSLSSSDLTLTNVKAEVSAKTKIINEVRTIDADLVNLEKNVQSATNALDLLLDKEKNTKSDKETLLKDIENLKTKISELEKYLNEHSQDKALISDLSGIETSFSILSSLQDELKGKQKEIETLTKEQSNLTKKHQEENTRLTALNESKEKKQQLVDAAKNKLETLLDNHTLEDYEKDLNHNKEKKRLVETIYSLEEHRSQLKDGCQCPLCGAKEHPFALGNVPKKGEYDDTISSLESKISDIKTSQNALASVKEDFGKLELELVTAQGSFEKSNSLLENNKQAIDKAQAELKLKQDEFTQKQQNIVKSLTPYGITSIDEDVAKILETLTKQKVAYEKAQNEKQELEKTITANDTRLSSLESQLEGGKKDIAVAQQALEQVTVSFNENKKIRQEKFSDKNPDTEEQKLKDKETAAQSDKEKAQKQHSDALNAQNHNQQAIEDLTKKTVTQAKELTDQNNVFNSLLKDNDFECIEEFLKAKLPDEDAISFRKQRELLSMRQIELSTRKADLEKSLKEHDEKALTKDTIEVIDERIEQKNRQNELDNEQLTEINTKLAVDKRDREGFAKRQQEITDAKASFEIIKDLYDLIGSVDGKKFRNFAQGLTFEIMVNYANAHLSSMSDRYQLIRDENEPLNLCVVDTYEGGEVRSIKNLSGGESFIVSLALAIGLSKMSSKKVRVDSLFLDEGFGTLDEESLTTAITTLAALHDEGKLIGVISHVAALQDSIGTRIEVTPQGLGHSTLLGPGVTFSKE